MDEMDEVVSEFLVESYENLDRLDRDLVDLERDPSPAKLAGIFRTIHTIKGTSGFLAFSKLESITHVGENLLSRLRDGELSLDGEITTGLLAMVDGVREILAAVESSGGEGDGDYSALVALLTRLNSRGAGSPEPEPEPARPGLEPAPGAGTSDTHAPAPVFGELLVQTGKASAAAVEQAVAEQLKGDPRHLGEILVEAGDLEPGDVADTLRLQGDGRGSVSDNNIRVDVSLLDKLMNLVGELVLARNQILQFTTTQNDAGVDMTGFVQTSQRLNLITTELQEGVMKTRMQPIGNVWSKFPRVVRDLALSCGKQVRIEMDGRETELDKTIIEAIKDPLTHLVRNAVDHGIESADARRAAGKSPEGRLTLAAFHEGGQVNIEISDDGGGLDVEQIKRRAVERGLVPAKQADRMSEREAMNLIFFPGFSTAEKITNVSGRGVGMDVVKTHIEKIGGTVDVQSRKGHGTTIRIKIPLTLAIIPALIVTSGGDRYAIPQVSLLELVRLEGEQARSGIETIHGAPVYRLRGNLLPLVYLHSELGVEEHGIGVQGESQLEAAGDTVLNIVVLQADDRQFGMVVGCVNDTEEIVVKPLGRQLKGVSAFAGATIMGDGKVALILDVLGLAQRSGVVSEVRDRSLVEARSEAAERASDHQTLLLVGVGQGAAQNRMAIPLSLVNRLEEFPRESMERAAGKAVVQYRGRILPLVFVSETLGNRGAGGADDAPMQVVVYRAGTRSVGLVVDAILDTVDESLSVERTGTKPGIIGSAVVQGRVTDIIDVEGLVRLVDPSFLRQDELVGV